ncbi:MAG: DNA/RNA nuclease SfsA [Oscillatoriophycideae cyanobacterium NC_groundwater_1537_Pr4_S-0.65um_50_18]|nr:DNA/RNA nuclease SfsA [Oscillatoriophycideae cyanobacterium NC_groundwater_1537_Pr4_S-0.65um_50_18]
MTDWVYAYPPLLTGTLIKRYKRFFADILLDSGDEIVAHCPNTGPMTGINIPGNRVLVSVSDSKTRKLPYTWEAIEVHDIRPTWVGVNTALPNRLIKAALIDKLFPTLDSYSEIRGEVPYGLDKKSRIDFFLTGAETDRPIYVEVKNTTWTKGEIALFPDTVTTRGQKHLRELTALLPQARSVMLYLINRSDCTQFAPGDSADPVYGKLLREAIAQGLEVLPCRFEVTPAGVCYLGLAELAI